MNKVTLYHGSYCVVKQPDFTFCSKAKDFGLGFYLTTDLNQAQNFIKTSVKKAVSRGFISPNTIYGFLNIYECDLKESLSIYSFKEADVSWLHCVAAHRSSNCFPDEVKKWNDYDLICGKIANDKTNTVISAYIDGLYGPVESVYAAEIAISFLEPEKLADQWCFKTQSALKTLTFLEAKKYGT